tara:strand:- start:603 stop:1070 length:468 start_codon:yes stop_codon:yes gene_type:complete
MATCRQRYKEGYLDKTQFKACKIKARNELKKLKQKGKSETKINRAKTSAAKADILKNKKDNKNKRAANLVKNLRTKNVNITGDRRMSGDNVKTDINKTKIDNSKKNKQTNLTNQQKQAQKQKQKQQAMGGAGGSSSSKAKVVRKKKKNPSNYDMY